MKETWKHFWGSSCFIEMWLDFLPNSDHPTLFCWPALSLAERNHRIRATCAQRRCWSLNEAGWVSSYDILCTSHFTWSTPWLSLTRRQVRLQAVANRWNGWSNEVSHRVDHCVKAGLALRFTNNLRWVNMTNIIFKYIPSVHNAST